MFESGGTQVLAMGVMPGRPKDEATVGKSPLVHNRPLHIYDHLPERLGIYYPGQSPASRPTCRGR